MSATFDVKLDTTVLDRIAAELGQNAREVVGEIAKDALELSQQIVPVDTGWLKSTGAVELEETGKALAIVAYEAEYAAYVELGTSKMGEQPYLLPSVQTAAFKLGVPMTWEVLFK